MNPNENPLISALINEQATMALKLIEMGESVNVANENDDTALMMAVFNIDVFQAVFEALLMMGADLNVRNKNGESVIHKIAEFGTVDELRLLPKIGMDLNCKDKYGNTPLHVAASYGEVEIVEMLLMLGAQVNAVNEAGETPLHQAVDGNIMSHEVKYHLQVVKILIQNGANVQAKTNKGNTPLKLAQQYFEHSPQSALKQILIDYGAK